MDNQHSIVTPEVGCESFEAGGVVYTRTPTLTIARAIKLQRLQVELQHNMYLPHVQQELQGMKQDFSSLKFVDGSSRLQKLIDTVDVIGTGRLREADICALFYNAPGEDPADDNHAAIITPKIAAWRAAGVDATFFTGAAWWLVAYFQNHSRQVAEAAEKLLREKGWLNS